METLKVIRKILIIGSVVGVIAWYVIAGYVYPEIHFYNYRHYGTITYDSGLLVGFIIMPLIFIVPILIIFKIISMIIGAVKKDTKNLKVFNDKKYLEAFSEVEENNIQNKELWAKAFAQCGGDKEKQKSIYVELRTKELSKGS